MGFHRKHWKGRRGSKIRRKLNRLRNRLRVRSRATGSRGKVKGAK